MLCHTNAKSKHALRFADVLTSSLTSWPAIPISTAIATGAPTAAVAVGRPMRAASLRTSSGDCVLQAIRADFASEVIDGLQHPLPCSRQDHRRFPPQNDNTGTCARTQPEGGGRPSRVVVLYGHTGTHHGTTGKTYFFPEVVTDRPTDCGKPRPRKAAEATTTNTYRYGQHPRTSPQQLLQYRYWDHACMHACKG